MQIVKLNEIDDPSGVPQASGLSVAEAEEANFQKSWVAYMWGRASLAAIQPHVSKRISCSMKSRLLIERS